MLMFENKLSEAAICSLVANYLNIKYYAINKITLTIVFRFF